MYEIKERDFFFDSGIFHLHLCFLGVEVIIFNLKDTKFHYELYTNYI